MNWERERGGRERRETTGDEPFARDDEGTGLESHALGSVSPTLIWSMKENTNSQILTQAPWLWYDLGATLCTCDKRWDTRV